MFEGCRRLCLAVFCCYLVRKEVSSGGFAFRRILEGSTSLGSSKNAWRTGAQAEGLDTSPWARGFAEGATEGGSPGGCPAKELQEVPQPLAACLNLRHGFWTIGSDTRLYANRQTEVE